MARTKAQKKEIVEKLGTIMNGAKSLVFVNVHGLKVGDATAMRRELTKNGVGFFVSKKTLTGLALDAKKYMGTMPALAGEFGLAYGTDLVAPARGIYEFQKKFKDQVSILGGVFENRYMSREEMLGIASIPPLSTLHGMFVNIINSPIQGLVVALSEIAKKSPAAASAPSA
ncbi:MAG: 50S ribosomal protein L10 [Patescibacteria group bacterium]|nr:50S ribosomal protein L10 [Patescibacteria group bacterium]